MGKGHTVKVCECELLSFVDYEPKDSYRIYYSYKFISLYFPATQPPESTPYPLFLHLFHSLPHPH